MKLQNILKSLVVLIVLYYVSIYTTTNCGKRQFPRGSWEIYVFCEQDNNRIDNVKLSLIRSELPVDDFEKGSHEGKLIFSNQVPFDNFVNDREIVSQTGMFVLSNTREIVILWKRYRIFWVIGKSELLCDRYPKINIKLKLEAEGYLPKIIDYEEIFSHKPLNVYLEKQY